MRVLLVTSGPYPHLGGVSTHLRLLIDGLQEQGHDVEILHPFKNPSLWEWIWKSMQELGLAQNPLTYYEAAQTALEMQFLQLNEQFDVVHAHDTFAWNALADVVPRDTPFVLTAHSEYHITWEMPNLSPDLIEYTELCQTNSYTNADVFLTVGDGIANDFFRTTGRRPTVLKSTIDIPRFAVDRSNREMACRAIGLDPKRTILFAPHRMEPLKGNHYLIEAMDVLVHAGRKEFQLIIAGQGSETNALQAMVRERGLTDHVRLVDSIAWDQIPLYYHAAHLFLSGSKTEGLPISLLEAMAAGLPTVAGPCRGIDETVEHQVTGLLVEKHDGRLFAEAILRVTDDAELYNKMAKAARRIVEPYGLDHFLRRLIDLYQNAVSSPRHRVREHSGRMYLATQRVAASLGIPEKNIPKPFRVLVGSLDYPRMGGVTSHVRKLARALRRRGAVVDVVHPARFQNAPRPFQLVHAAADATGLQLRQPDMLDLYWDEQAVDLQAQVAAMRSQGLRWDAVHCHDIVSAARLAAVTAGVPLFCTTHGPAVEEELAKGHIKPGTPEEIYLRNQEATTLDYAQAVFVVGAELKQRIEHRYPNAPLALVPNWVDTAQFKSGADKLALRRRLGLPENEFLVFCPSRIDFNKGVEYLVQAADKVRGTIVLIRSHPGADEFVRKFKKGGTVKLIDPVDVNQMPDLYNAMDVCVLPSIRVAGTQESFPISALEAVACEVPLVSTGVGGLGEILRQVGLQPIQEKSPSSISVRIQEIQRNPNAARLAAQNARQRLIALYSEDVVVQQMLEHYQREQRSYPRELVLPFRSVKAHADQILWLLGEGRTQQASDVFLARALSADEEEFLRRYLALWLQVLTELGADQWRTALVDWIQARGWSVNVRDADEPVQPDLPDLVNHLRHEEYKRRVAGLSREKQMLTRRERVKTEPLHVVYVMAHVGLTGGAKVIFEHANHLVQAGTRVTIVSHFPKPDWFPVSCDFIQIPLHLELACGIPLCDVIVATYWEHIQPCVDSGIAPVVYFEQGDFHLFEELQPDLLEIVTKQIQSAAYVITCSGRIEKILQERYGRPAQIVPNAVDRSVFFPRSQDAPVDKKPYLLMMGSDQIAFKGTRDVLKAYDLVREAGYELDLHWVSPAPLAEPRGHVHIQPEQKLLGDLYRSATVFVSGSYYETFPLPPIEAMASNCPVVSTANTGVMTYGVDGENCLLAEIGNPEDLARKIIRVLTDDTLRSHLKENGLRTAARFDWTEIAGQLRAFYEDVAEQEPAMRGKISDWEFVPLPFLEQDGWPRLERLLKWTRADAVLVPVVYSVLDEHAIARWEVVACRRNTTPTRLVQLWSPLQGDSTDLPYNGAYRKFAGGRYAEALQEFMAHRNQSSTPAEQAVFTRWAVLCLIELQRDPEALALVNEAIKLDYSNTDFLYLRAILMKLTGRADKVDPYLEKIMTLGESAAFPEFFWGIQELARKRLPGR